MVITMVVDKDTRIILEATAAFAPATEYIFQRAIETLKASKAVIMIA